MGSDTDRGNLREEPIPLPPDGTAVVQTLEEVKFPIFLYGRLGSMSKMASQGILTIYGHQVDPGFSGPLFVTLRNMSSNIFQLSYGRQFLSLEIMFLPVTPGKPYVGINQDRHDFSIEEIRLVEKE